MEKSGTVGQTTDENISWRMRIALWITTATDTYIQNTKNLLLFHIKNGYANASQCYFYTYIARPV